MKKLLALMILGAGLMGCAEQQAAVVAANSVAKGVAQNTVDDTIAGDRELLCAQPYSGLARNASKDTGLAIAIPALCGPMPTTVTTTTVVAKPAP